MATPNDSTPLGADSAVSADDPYAAVREAHARVEALQQRQREFTEAFREHRMLRSALTIVKDTYLGQGGEHEETLTDALFAAIADARGRLLRATPSSPTSALDVADELLSAEIASASKDESILTDVETLDAIRKAVAMVRPVVTAARA